MKPRIKLTAMHAQTFILSLLKGSKKYYESEYWQRRKLKEGDLSNYITSVFT